MHMVFEQLEKFMEKLKAIDYVEERYLTSMDNIYKYNDIK